MSAWLNASAMPIYAPPSSLEGEAFQAESQRLQQELKDIADVKRVHFISAVRETRPLNDVVKGFEAMPVNVQAHARRIVNKFPQMLAYLVKRLAVTNVEREERLRGRQSDYCGGVPDSEGNQDCFHYSIGLCVPRLLSAATWPYG
jgi:hypothetical protein